jgi:hypothetical protein
MLKQEEELAFMKVISTLQLSPVLRELWRRARGEGPWARQGKAVQRGGG